MILTYPLIDRAFLSRITQIRSNSRATKQNTKRIFCMSRATSNCVNFPQSCPRLLHAKRLATSTMPSPCHADRGKQVSLCYIAIIDASRFAVAAIVWTPARERVDDQEKLDGPTRFWVTPVSAVVGISLFYHVAIQGLPLINLYSWGEESSRQDCICPEGRQACMRNRSSVFRAEQEEGEEEIDHNVRA